MPARGLHGEAYRGHIFWDELFIFPVLNLRLPMITRSLLGYRYRRLPEARHAAKAAGYSGAMFRGNPAAMDARKANAYTSIRAAAGGTPTRALVRTTSASPLPIARGTFIKSPGISPT